MMEMRKEVDLFTNMISKEDDTVDVDNDDDDDDESERCGICMEMVVDRGLLDCCHDWFCFVFATTPLDDDPLSRDDDDWSVQDKNNTLSFPSYYIDENAVACLDRDGCKIRSGSLTPEEASTLDTSIACDSCDIWYHATCVGFDPEGSEVDTWLCPRCLVNRAEQKSESKEMFNTEGQLSLSIGDHHSFVRTCSGKVSISIADDGETALVISRVDGEDVAKEPITNCISTQEVMSYRGNKQSMLSSDPCSSELNEPLDQGIKAIQPQPQPTIVPVKLEEYDVDCGSKEEESSTSVDLKLSVPSTSANKLLFHASDRKPSITENLADQKTNLAPKTVKKRKNA